MAYRFLLEVPENLSADANVAVATAGDAQIVVERPAHGLGFDDHRSDLTVAAHSLQVINNLYRWANEIGATRPDSRFQIGVVLHSGRRMGLQDLDAPAMVAAIRRDQPWVERSVPKIGLHERDLVSTAASTAPVATPVAIREEISSSTIIDVNLIDAEDEITVNGRNYAAIQVLDLAPAERLYADVLGLVLYRRMRQDGDAVWHDLGDDYDHETAADENTEADIAFLHNGPLNVALVRAGRAARLDYGTIRNQIAIAMTIEAAARVKALVLMRGYTMLSSTGPAFAFRDPFGVAWNVHPH